MQFTYSYSGRRVSAEEGTPSISDVAVALCRLVRYAGNCAEFWTVGTHSFVVADLLPDRLKIFGLVHDFGESLTADCPSPFKTDDFRALESRIMCRFYSDLGLPQLSDEDRIAVKDADHRAFLGEVATIAPSALRSTVTDRCPEAEVLIQKYLDEYSFDDLLRPDGRAVKEFLRRFQIYRSLL